MTRIKSSSNNTKTIDAFLRFMGLHSDGNQKGNKGRGAARRRLQFMGTILMLLVCILGVVHLCFPSRSSAATRGVIRHAKQFRRKMLKGQGNAKFTHKELVELVLEGKLNLVDIRPNRRELSRSDEDTYEGIFGLFCQLNFKAHKDDPSGVPMFRDMVKHSPMCEGEYDPKDPARNQDEVPRGKVMLNLKELAHKAREADRQGSYPYVKNLDLKGVVFHESRCGSTLVANALIAMNPTKHRVYSESAPPIAALNVCAQSLEGDDEGPCSIDQGAKIVQDVMYLMGRSQDRKEERYFFKIQSAGTKSLAVFRRAFPTTPWIFVYRNPVEVMMSHFAEGVRTAKCLSTKNHPPRMLQRLARKRGYYAEGADDDGNGADDENDAEETSSQLERMGNYEYCAAHLATLTETAADQIIHSAGLGKAVNYVNLPHILYEKILPSWGVSVSAAEIENIQQISGQYSKGRGQQKGDWHEDSQKKQAIANADVQDASKIFLQASFDRLEKLASTY